MAQTPAYRRRGARDTGARRQHGRRGGRGPGCRDAPEDGAGAARAGPALHDGRRRGRRRARRLGERAGRRDLRHHGPGRRRGRRHGARPARRVGRRLRDDPASGARGRYRPHRLRARPLGRRGRGVAADLRPRHRQHALPVRHAVERRRQVPHRPHDQRRRRRGAGRRLRPAPHRRLGDVHGHARHGGGPGHHVPRRRRRRLRAVHRGGRRPAHLRSAVGRLSREVLLPRPAPRRRDRRLPPVPGRAERRAGGRARGGDPRPGGADEGHLRRAHDRRGGSRPARGGARHLHRRLRPRRAGGLGRDRPGAVRAAGGVHGRG